MRAAGFKCLIFIFTLGCGETSGNYDVEFNLIEDGCGFFDDDSFSNDTWGVVFDENQSLFIELGANEEGLTECYQSEDSYTCEEQFELELENGAILGKDMYLNLTFDRGSFTGAEQLDYSCIGDVDCMMEDLPCSASVEVTGTIQ